MLGFMAFGQDVSLKSIWTAVTCSRLHDILIKRVKAGVDFRLVSYISLLTDISFTMSPAGHNFTGVNSLHSRQRSDIKKMALNSSWTFIHWICNFAWPAPIRSM